MVVGEAGRDEPLSLSRLDMSTGELNMEQSSEPVGDDDDHDTESYS